MTKHHTALLLTGCLLLAVFLAMALFPGIFTSYGARETLLIGFVSSLLMIALGSLIGILSAMPGVTGALFSGLINIFMLLPHLITLIVISAFVGHSAAELIVLIAVFGWVGTARNVRAQVVHLNSQPFIETLRIQGFGRFPIIFRHILPNLYDLLLFRFLLGVNSCIMMESTLSFLGIGDVYTPTWGTMVNLAYKRGAFMRRAFNYLLPPGICIMLLSLSFYFISMAVEARREQIDL